MNKLFNLLASKFVDDYKNENNPHTRLALISLSSIISIVINVLLSAGKLIVGVIVNSAAIINDGFNNLSDTIVAIMAFVGAKISRKPADKEHPHGYGRGEALITLLVSILIMYVGFSLLINSLGKFKEDNIVSINYLTMGVLVISILVKVYIYFLNRRLYRNLDSELNLGVMIDSRNDILSTLAIIISLYLQKYINFNLDALAGVILSGAVFMPGFNMFRDTMNYLLGQRLSPEVEKKLGDLLMDNHFIIGYHGLEIHDYGKGHMDGTVDVEIAQNISLLAAHQLITDIQKEVEKETGIRLNVHLDPTYSLILNDNLKREIEQLEKQAINEYDDF